MTGCKKETRLQLYSRGSSNWPLKKRLPANSMEAPSELVGGNQNDQAAQPSAANQNNQLVQLSADKNKNKNKREADKKYRDGKKKKTAGILEQNQTLIADKAKLKRKLASTK
ncbi:hypothetical protein D5086_025654, partial [Populus alba]